MPDLDNAAAAVAKNKNTIDDVAATVVQQQRQAVQSSLYGALLANPDMAARAQRLGKRTGLPADLVERNLPDVEHRARLHDIDTVLQDSPTLAQWLANQGNAKIAHDDVEAMGQIERKLRMFAGGIPEAVGGALSGVGTTLDILQRNALKGFAKVFLPKPTMGARVDTNSLPGPMLGEAWNFTGTKVLDSAEAIRKIPVGQRTFGDDVAGGLGQVAGQLIMLPVLRGAGIYAQGAHVMSEKVKGDDASQEAKDLAILGGAAVTGVTEKWALDKLLGPMAVPIKNQLAASLARIGIAGAAEGGQEFAENVLHDVLRKTLTNPDAEINLGQSAYEGGVGATVGAIVRTLVESALHIKLRGARATEVADNLSDLSKLTEASKLRNRDPDSAQLFFQSVLADGNPDVWITPEDLAQSGVADKIAAAMPSLAEQLDTAIVSNHDIRLPIAELLAKVSGDDLRAIVPRVSEEPGGFTQLSADEFYQSGEADKLMTDLAEAAEGKQGDSEFQQSADAVKRAIVDQINSTGRWRTEVSDRYATLIGKWFEVASERLGITPGEMFDRYRLGVKGDADYGRVLRQDAQVTGPFGPIFTEYKGDTNGAVAKLTEMKSGEAVSALHHSEIGDIDLVWGEEGTGASDGYGLAKLVKYHPEVISDLQGIVSSMSVVSRGKNRINLESDDHRAGVRLTWDNQAKHWLLTAFRKREKEGADATRTDTSDPSGKDATASLTDASDTIVDQKIEKFYQGGANVKGSFNPETLTISLLKGADLSTFLHEAAHFFLEVQFDIASGLSQRGYETLSRGEQRIVDDTNRLLEWFGVSDLGAWYRLSFEERRPYHEQFARSFEAYLFRGKAPSIELQPLFQTFREWMKRVYKSVKDFITTNPDAGKINDDVRAVFDRMLATDDEIAFAQRARSMVPLFTSPDQAGMSVDEYEEYLATNSAATSEAVQKLQARSLRDLQWFHNAHGREVKRLQRLAESQRQAIRTRVAEEVNARPVYRADRFLRFGELESDPMANKAQRRAAQVANIEGAKLSLPALKEMYGEEANALWRFLSVGKNGLAATEGMHPDMVAELFGFDSGDQLVRELLAAPKRKDEIEALTDVIMLEEHGELSSPEAIARAADAAIHNDLRTRAVTTEANALADAVGNKRILNAAAKEFASTTVSRLRVGGLKPHQYTNAETRAAKAAAKAMSANDLVTAAAEKRNQVLNMQLAKATYSAQEEVEKIVKHFRQLGKSSSQKAMRGDYLLYVNNLLARFDLRAKGGETELGLAEWVEEEVERLSAISPDIPAWVLDGGYVKHYRDLTVGELRELNDAVRQLEFIARREQQMYKAVRNQTYQDEVGGLLREIRDARPEAFDEVGEPLEYRKDALPLLEEFRGRFKSKFDAEFLNIENLLDVMTVGKGVKVFESLFGRLSSAADNRTAFMKQLGEYINNATKAYTVRERQAMAFTKQLVPGTQRYMTREQRIAVALFYGSTDGRQRLADGNKISASDTAAILHTLDEKDWNLVRTMWALSDNLIWPELSALNERTTGIAPAKVQPAPFDTKFGPMPGGYVPLVYDGDMDQRAHDLNTNSSVKELLGGSATVAATQRSASKRRAAKVDRSLDLSLRAMAMKLNETVHDITHREAVADTYRLLQSKRVSNVMRSLVGPDAYNAMLYHVREIAVKPRTPTGFSEKFVWYLRKNTLVNMMGASFNTVAINVLGVVPAVRRVGPGRFIRALGGFLSPNAAERYAWVLDKSPYMRERLAGFDRDMNEELSRLSVGGGLMPSLSFWFAGLSVMDRAITMPTWVAAYEQGMEKCNNDEAAAALFADRTIRQTQGAGRVVDLAKIAGGVGPAGEFKRIITMFYNFFNAQLGSIRRSGAIGSSEWDAGNRFKAAAIIALDVLAIIVLPSFLEALARGQCGGDDEDASDYLYCAARSSAIFTAGFFPILRDVLPYTWRQFDPEYQGGFGVRLSPVENALQTMASVPKSSVDDFTGDSTEYDYKTLVHGAGYLFGLPGFQTWRTLDAYRAYVDGESDDLTDFLTGPPREK